MVPGILELGRLALTNPKPNSGIKDGFMVAYERRVNESREIITTVPLNDGSGFNRLSICIFH